MKYPKVLLKEITPNELKYKLDTSFVDKEKINDYFLVYSRSSIRFNKKFRVVTYGKRQRELCLKNSFISNFCKEKYKRELTVKEQFLIKIMI